MWSFKHSCSCPHSVQSVWIIVLILLSLFIVNINCLLLTQQISWCDWTITYIIWTSCRWFGTHLSSDSFSFGFVIPCHVLFLVLQFMIHDVDTFKESNKFHSLHYMTVLELWSHLYEIWRDLGIYINAVWGWREGNFGSYLYE